MYGAERFCRLIFGFATIREQCANKRVKGLTISTILKLFCHSDIDGDIRDDRFAPRLLRGRTKHAVEHCAENVDAGRYEKHRPPCTDRVLNQTRSH